MRKLLITVFAAHWLVFSGLAQAQVPSGSIDLKAKNAQTGTEESVRELAYGFRTFRLDLEGNGGFGVNHDYCGSTLAALSSCTINLQLDTSSGGCGTYTGTFYVYDSATNSAQKVALLGTGVNHIAGGC